MRCPDISELPSPPSGKTGWPWTEASPAVPNFLPDGSPWPRVTIVTASYNQGQFIEETVRSVLLQGYPDLEYILLDGGSNDESVEIIRKYQSWLAYWVSQPDQGQSDAINRGFARASGEVFAWLNSDDIYLSGAFDCAARAIQQGNKDVVWGNTQVLDAASRPLRISDRHAYTKSTLYWGIGTLPQPGVFWRRCAWTASGGLDKRLYFTMDYDLWIRMAARPELAFSGVDQLVAAERVHSRQKTTIDDPQGRRRMYAEMAAVFRKHHPALLDALRFLLMRRFHLAKRGRNLKSILTDIEAELAIFKDGAGNTSNPGSRGASRPGFSFSYRLLRLYARVARPDLLLLAS